MRKDIIYYGFKNGLPQEFEIVDLEELYKEFKDTLTTTHRTGFYHIIWFQHGCPLHLVDFNPIEIKPNTLLFLNKDTVQQFDKTTKFSGKAILFTDSFFCQTEADTKFLRNSILFNDLFSISRIEITKYLDLFANILQQMTDELQNTKDNSQTDILQNLLHNFLLHAERERRKQNFSEIKKDANLDYVLLFKDLLEVEYKDQKQVNYYARQIIITEKRLNIATTKVLGKSPKELIDERILLEAKRILAHTTESVKEIAYYLGFEEPTNFIKYFKKHLAVTPIEFREKNTMA
ncbi:helix-turn-helix domain-containing protein [Flavobacterium daejeonense]|uniref:helix-turn-helix domain-containing protein n=1 Tax=Flavobacterium daejeonense TaxID=350893 RepID=UPI0005548D37|nr:helix-turn-helix domain-containing protein [Flavobacterium daejeonense]